MIVHDCDDSVDAGMVEVDEPYGNTINELNEEVHNKV